MAAWCLVAAINVGMVEMRDREEWKADKTLIYLG